MKFVRLCIVPFALLFVVITRLISRYRIVRFGDLYTERLGHLIGNTESYLCEKDSGMHEGFIDFWVPVTNRISSKAVFNKYKKVIHVLPRWFGSVVLVVNRLFIGWEKHCVGPRNNDRDILNLWPRFSPHIGFTKSEERKGQKLLRQLGISEGAKWVCLFIRDSAYLKEKAPGLDYSYHDYRDSDVDNCMPAVVELISRGYYVVRVGDIVAKPFHVKHSHVIDYPYTKYKSDFGHFYLGAKCAFVLGTSSGFMAISQAFNKPVCIINYVPLEYMTTYSKGLSIWKHHLKDGKKMTPKEIYSSGLGLCTFGHNFTKMGVTLEENTAQEIYLLVKEMDDRLQGKTESEEQETFWNALPRSIVFGVPLHGKMVMRIGTQFLEGYK